MKKKMTITIAILLIIAAGVFGVKYLNKDTDKSSDNKSYPSNVNAADKEDLPAPEWPQNA